MLKFSFKVPDRPIYKSAKATEYFKTNRVKIFASVMPLFQTGIILKTPVGATGLLRKSNLITWGDTQSKIVNELSYAPAVNDGRDAKPVAASADLSLDKWIRLSRAGQSWFSALQKKYKKITVAQAIFILKRSKKKKKTPGRRFFEEGLEKAQPSVDRQFKIILKRMAEEMK